MFFIYAIPVAAIGSCGFHVPLVGHSLAGRLHHGAHLDGGGCALFLPLPNLSLIFVVCGRCRCWSSCGSCSGNSRENNAGGAAKAAPPAFMARAFFMAGRAGAPRSFTRNSRSLSASEGTWKGFPERAAGGDREGRGRQEPPVLIEGCKQRAGALLASEQATDVP